VWSNQNFNKKKSKLFILLKKGDGAASLPGSNYSGKHSSSLSFIILAFNSVL
jgi:hypothetical protein